MSGGDEVFEGTLLSTHDFESPRPPPSLPARRAARVGALTAAALALHALVLGGADWVWPSTAPPPLPAASLEVRVVALAARAEVEPIATAPAPQPRPATPPKKAVAKPVAVAASRPAVQPPAVLSVVERSQPEPMAAASSSADEATIPLYRTQLPPAAMLRYRVSRGALHGTGELLWRPQGERYELTLDFRLGGLTILSQSSTGGIDPAGIAPVRFTDTRPRRGTSAANFQRDANKITYSGSSSEFALKSGAQDRLSWMLQIAAIVSAEPQLAMPGARVVMQVTGSRGDAGVWVFRCLGAERVDARGGAIDALKFMREPREAYDTTVEVWLDPNQHHLPVRATQKSGANDEGYELRLIEASTPN